MPGCFPASRALALEMPPLPLASADEVIVT
jgi:hypothetical protein